MTQTPQMIGRRLKTARKHYGLTQWQMAELAGIGPPTWSEIEAGKKELSKWAAIKLCDALDLSMDYIFRGRVLTPQDMACKLSRAA